MLTIPNTRMWNLASSYLTENIGISKNTRKVVHSALECSNDDDDDDGASSGCSRDEGLECSICCESFNIVENVPYVLWCGHTLCKNCVLGLQWAIVKFPAFPVQLPLFISCPWCNRLSFRLVFRGALKFPSKNYFLLWMVERMNGERLKSRAAVSANSPNRNSSDGYSSHAAEPPCHHHNHHHSESIQNSLRNSLVLLIHMTAKFPLVIILLVIVFYAVPTSVAILAAFVLITLLLAIPSFLILYFSYPCLDWLVKEILT